MAPQGKLLGLATLGVGAGLLLACSAGLALATATSHITLPLQTAPATWTCNNAATVPCNCVKRQDNTFCYDPSQTLNLIWCTQVGGGGPCVSNGSPVMCPSDGAAVVVGGTTCTDSTGTSFICSGVSVNTCNSTPPPPPPSGSTRPQ